MEGTCYCGKKATKLQTKKPGPNLHRWFHVCPVKQCNYFKWVGKRCVDSSWYNSRMEKTQRRRQEQEEKPYTLEGSGVIAAIQNRSTSVQFHLRSIDKIAIIVGDNGYSLLDALRQLPAVTFDETAKEWIMPATFQCYTNAYESLLTSPHYRTIYSTPLADTIIRFLPHDHSTTNTSDHNSGDKATMALDVEERIKINVKSHSIWNHMMDYQQQGVRECLLKGGRVLLADDMGLGKTIQALAVSLAYSDSWPVLVICPTSLLFTWLDQIQQWLYPVVSNKDIRITLKGSDLFGFSPPQVLPVAIAPSQHSLVDMDPTTDGHHLDQLVSQPQYQARGTSLPIQSSLSDGSQKTTSTGRSSFNIISYDTAAAHCGTLLGMDFKFIIADESHALKNPKAKRTMALTPLLQKADHILLLTGTPILSRPIELYPQLRALQKDLFPDMNQFGLRYCSGRKGKYGWDMSGSSNLVELNFILQKSVMVRRLKSQVRLSLPSKIRQKLRMTIDSYQKQHLANLKQELIKLNSSSSSDLAKKSKCMQLYKATGTAKIPSILACLDQLLSTTTTGKVLIFAFHRDVMDAIEKQTMENKIAYIRIDGDTKQTDRHAFCLRFQSTDQQKDGVDPARVAILSITAGNVGLNFQAATTVVFAELYWNPSHILQAEDRAHHCTHCAWRSHFYLDDWLWALLYEKFQVMQQLLN
ncbi:hypothetical protein [Absidia glauca]|uniref:Helicase ATP-binding domain-containing protein n=1 Tax=Absidia glauca TaxID=4829 RepID=A0A163JYS8_ABSGL|nr:hypothetical protein [Absidia glauca]